MDENDIQENVPSTEDLYKAIADVLDEALVEYDELVKMEGQGIDYAQAIDDKKGDGPKASGPDGSTGEGTGAADNSGAGAMTKEDDKDKDKKDKDKDDDDDDDDEKMLATYKSLCEKMEARGLMRKQEIIKSETATESKSNINVVDNTGEIKSLRKSTDDKLETLTKAIKAVSESVKKIAAQPVSPRKGLAGYKPLKKNESDGDSAPKLQKSEIVDKLLDLRKSGDERVNSLLINRVETNRLMPSDIETIKSVIGE